MQFSTVAIVLAVLALCSEAKLINVEVGNGGIYFKPDVIVAAIGDQVQFNFYNNHSVVQSNFIDPCVPIKNAFYSGFVVSEDEGPAKDSFVVTVNTKNAIWFYCSQGGHCQSGMSGVINSGRDALDSYMNAAIIAPDNVSPTTGVSGGKLGPVISSSSSSKSTKVSSTALASSSKTNTIVSTTSTSHKSSTTPTTHKSSTTSNKVSSNTATSSKTKPAVSSTNSPLSSSASRKHTMSRTTTALAIISAVTSLKTSSCTWRG